MSPARRKKPHGQIRQSQIVTTFGPGAMVDLPEYSVIVGGLDHWNGWRDQRINEERLEAKVKTLLGLPSVELYGPPPDPDDPTASPNGITAWQFPEWFIVQMDVRAKDGTTRSRPLVHRRDLVKREYEHERKRYPVVPVRFVQACDAGHVSDVDWRLFVHGKGSECQRAPLWMDEKGTTGDLTAITIRCECGAFKALSAATKRDDIPLGYCEGHRPWLGGYGREQCSTRDDKPRLSKLLIRAASNAYFAQTLSVISIPEGHEDLRKAVDALWDDHLSFCGSEQDVTVERRRPKVSAGLDGFSDADVWAEIQRRRSDEPPPSSGIRDVELRTLLSSKPEVGNDKPGGDFYARSVPLGAREARWFSRIVKVHRLREVIAQVGFTRFDAAVADIQGELDVDVERAALAREMKWVPAVENRGEGVFVALKKESVDSWLARPSVVARAKKLHAGYNAWRKQKQISDDKFPGALFVMLHSLSHLLITSVALDCGYAASSIRERIYVGEEGCGVLLYTASPDAEGTLGGLVEAADRMGQYLQQALDYGRLCANDPVCAHHRPDSAEEDRLLLGAACHGCLLLAESSCERRNDFLDRALVVPTVDEAEAAFFREDEV